MNTQKSVFNKISKIQPQEVESKEVELSEQKIELSLLSDFEQEQKQAEDGFVFARRHKASIIASLNEAAKDTQRAISGARSAISSLDEIIKKADEIGINYPDATKDKSDLESLLKQLEGISLSYGKARKAINEV